MSACPREQARLTFLEQHGHKDSKLVPLQADASSRCYTRLLRSDKSAAPTLLMDAPPQKEKPRQFHAVSAFLQNLGLRAPRILQADLEQGFLEIEDFGDESFTHLLEQGADPKPLYEDAVAVLLHLLRTRERAQTPSLPAFSVEEWCDESAVFADFYAPALATTRDKTLSEASTQKTRASWRNCWHDLLTRLPPLPEVLVLRDCHVDNLMRVAPQRKSPNATANPQRYNDPQRYNNLQRCGLLDFQDAVLGSPAYDLVSLLEDARRDLKPALRQHLLRLYLQGAQSLCSDNIFSERNFLKHYRVWGAQRHARVLGTFARLALRDGKTKLSCHIPRVYALLERNLAQDAQSAEPVLEPLSAWFSRHLPAHREQLQKALKEGIFGYRADSLP